MNRRVIVSFLTAGACALAVFVGLNAAHLGTSVAEDNQAAFRDGFFIGHLDARTGRYPHLAIGRWQSDSDRRSYVSGYMRAYSSTNGVARSGQWMSGLAGERGYIEGLADGLEHRRAAWPFRVAGTQHFQNADSGFLLGSGKREEYKRTYRQAYLNGYELAYYGAIEPAEVANLLSR